MPTTTTPDTQVTGIERHLVHKVASSEVFLTGCHARDDGTFGITARWPRDHGFYRSLDGHYDSLLFAETIRQTLPLLSHTAFGVPLGYQLIWNEFSFEVVHEELRVGAEPLDVTLVVERGALPPGRNTFRAMSVSATAVAGGTTIGSAVTSFSAHSPAIYRRLRGGRHDAAEARARSLVPAPGERPERVGRLAAGDVVLSPTGEPGTWQLRVDLDHPFLFDHPVDHIPGMLLLEAARQATIAACSPGGGSAAVTGMTTRFHRYVELDRPARLQLSPDGPDLFSARVVQDEQICFEIETAVQTALPAADHV
ncbi:ScbA/BarX family gamma-butyrolactone biosynthesis protein [Streptomyces sp. NPDC002308]